MITARKATREERKRDRRRDRLVLVIGKNKYRITKAEALLLAIRLLIVASV